MKNLRHNIDPILVAIQTEHAISRHERFRTSAKACVLQQIEAYKHKPTMFNGLRSEKDLEWIDPHYDSVIKREKQHYAKVRVIRIASRKYILVYGNAKDSTVKRGTGPFKTLREAKNWYLHSGR